MLARPRGCTLVRMARVVFTQQLARFIEAPEVHTGAPTLRGALDAAFAANPRLRSYVLDDQGHLRQHVVIFIDGHRVRDTVTLDAHVGATSEVHVMQALSGG